MRRLTRTLLQITQVLFLALVGLTMLGASSPDHRFDKLGHNLMCTCGCGEVLLECNHVGCPTSGPMIQELHAQLATALPDAGILHWFATRYGPIVLASPVRGGFDLVAWIMPFAVLALGIAGVVALVGMWRRRHLKLQIDTPAASPHHISDSLRDRIRRDTDFNA